MKERISHYPVLAFIALTAAITGSGWGLLLTIYGRAPIDALISQPLAIVLIYTGATGPSLAAIILTGYTKGKDGLRELGHRFTRIKFPAGTWLLAMGLPLLLAVMATLLHSIFSETLGDIVLPAWYRLLPPALFVALLAGPLCEEVGWRGYLQPHLLNRFSVTGTAVIIGTIWCFWHIPLSFTPGTTPPLSSPGAWGLYWVDTILVSAIMLAIVVHASGSILAAIAFHWMSNIALSGILQPLYPAATDSAWSEVQQIHLVLLAICTPIALWLAHRRVNRDAEPNGHLQQRRQHL